eukprot:15364472-Ditylum_brightwellii.AAC.1
MHYKAMQLWGVEVLVNIPTVRAMKLPEGVSGATVARQLGLISEEKANDAISEDWVMSDERRDRNCQGKISTSRVRRIIFYILNQTCVYKK